MTETDDMTASTASHRALLTAFTLALACPPLAALAEESETEVPVIETCGGYRLEAEISDPAKREDPALIKAVGETLSRRVASLDKLLARTEVTDTGHFRIEIPGEQDIDRLKTWLAQPGDTAFYRILADGEQETASEASGLTLPATHNPPAEYRLDPDPILTGSEIKSADVTWDRTNQPSVLLALDEEGTRLLAEFTGSHVGEQLAIAVNGKVVSAPLVHAPITEGRLMIGGQPSLAETRELALDLDAGVLPAEIDYLNTQTYERADDAPAAMCDLID